MYTNGAIVIYIIQSKYIKLFETCVEQLHLIIIMVWVFIAWYPSQSQALRALQTIYKTKIVSVVL